MKQTTIASFIAIAAILAFSTGCSTTSVSRIEAGGTKSLVSQNVDLADFKAAASEISQIIVTNPTFANFAATKGRKPVIEVGAIVNKSDILIDLGQIAGRINEDLMNSGIVNVIAQDAGVKSSNEEERRRQAFESDRSIARAPKPDFRLEGTIMLLTAADGRNREKTYTFQIRVNDVATGFSVLQRTVDVGKQFRKPLF